MGDIRPSIPNTKFLIGDKGYDSKEFREAFERPQNQSQHSTKIKPDSAKELSQNLVQTTSQG
jgi:hypothetical protein